MRTLALRRGTLTRLPKFNPGDPDAPILPAFDIRIDRLDIERLTVAEGVAGPQRRVDLAARVLIKDGKALIRADGRLGGGERLQALLDAEPDRDRFDIKLDYNAPKGGLLAGLAGADRAIRLGIGGKGSWRRWDGALLAEADGKRLAALQLTNRAGTYGVVGQAWPEGMLSGLAARAAGGEVAISASGTYAGRVVDGDARLIGDGLALQARGGVDLAGNAVRSVAIVAEARDPERLFPGIRLEQARLTGTLDGPFRQLRLPHRLTVARLVSGTTRIETLAQTGTASWDGARLTLPLDAGALRIVTGDPALDARLVTPRVKGTVVLSGSQIAGDSLSLAVPGVAARLALRGDMDRGGFGLAGPIAARGLALTDLGSADAEGRIIFKFGKAPWSLDAQLDGRMVRVDNATLTTLAGSGIRFGGHFRLGRGQPILFEQATLSGSRLALGLAGRSLPGGRTTLTGRGRQVDYGAFTVEADIASDGPRAVLTFADPLPAAGLKDVRVALSPIAGGFRIETRGDSMLGPFNGTLGLFAKSGGPVRIAVERLEVWKTTVTGMLALDGGFASGNLRLAGGGISGTIGLAAQGGGQGFTAALTASDARFGGAVPLTIGSARLEATGLLRKGHSSVSGNLLAQGIGQGQLFIGRLAASAKLTNGQGQVTASIAGRRGSRFDLQLLGDIAPDRLALAAQGQYAGQRIMLPRRAVLTRETGGWRLSPTQVDFAGGKGIASGLLGGEANELHLALANMPLSLADVAVADLGLGGKISGLIDYRQVRRAPPTGDFKVRIAGLTRSGLVLTSRPIDAALTGSLMPDRLEMRAVISEGGQVRGRLQGRIAGLARDGDLSARIQNGALFAQLRYSGPADALWRLAALESFDLTGPLEVAADLTGTPASPSIRGSLAGNGLQLQSALTGTSVSGLVRARQFFRLAAGAHQPVGPDGGRRHDCGQRQLRFHRHRRTRPGHRPAAGGAAGAAAGARRYGRGGYRAAADPLGRGGRGCRRAADDRQRQLAAGARRGDRTIAQCAHPRDQPADRRRRAARRSRRPGAS